MRQIFVDSRDKVPGGTSANFSIVLPQTLSLESGHQGRIDDFRLPMMIPTIYAQHNGISFVTGGSSFDIYIPAGQYNSLPELATAIKNELDKTTGSWTVTFDVRNTSMAISCSNDFQWTGGSYMKRLLERPYNVSADRKGYNFLYVPLQGLDVCYLSCAKRGYRGAEELFGLLVRHSHHRSLRSCAGLFDVQQRLFRHPRSNNSAIVLPIKGSRL